MKNVLLFGALLMLTACENTHNFVLDTPMPSDIQSLVNDENAYRMTQGLAPLTQGLGCTLYTFTSGDRIQPSVAGHNTLTGLSQVATFLYQGEFNVPDTNISQLMPVLPLALQPLYVNMYMLRCQGQVVITDDGYYNYRLTSDDGSVLYIDGAKVVDNDNGHGATLVSGMKLLRRGVHTFRLDYAQSGGGNQALILTSNNVLVDSNTLYH